MSDEGLSSFEMLWNEAAVVVWQFKWIRGNFTSKDEEGGLSRVSLSMISLVYKRASKNLMLFIIPKSSHCLDTLLCWTFTKINKS